MTAAQAEVVATSDSDSTSSLQKRKLSDVEAEPTTNGVASESEHSVTPEPTLTGEQLRILVNDIHTILQSHDPSTSILNYPLSVPDESGEPSSKRTKLSEDAQSPSIASKITNNQYSSIGGLYRDIQQVCEDVLQPVREKEATLTSGPYARHTGLSPEDAKLLGEVLAFQKVAKGLLRDDDHQPSKKAQANGFMTNGVKHEEDDKVVLEDVYPVLTISANAQGRKQLFSSLPEAYRVGEPRQSKSKELDTAVDVMLPIRESALPNFITLSKLPKIEAKGQSSLSQKKSRGLGEVFPSGSSRSAPTLHVPKPSNRLLTKSSSVSWVSPEKLRKPTSNRYNWATHKQHYGKWVSYNGVDSPQDPNSPEAKRRQRDRALSIGAPNPPQSEEARLAEEQAKEDALFRSVFTSFAPCVDNTGATVPDTTRNELWWDKIGRNRAGRVFIDPALLNSDEDKVDDAAVPFDDDQIDDLVDNFDPELLDTPDTKQEEEEDDVDKKLQEISNLIDTLYSYQKIRLSQIPSSTTPITPVGARPSLTEMIGTPSTPSTAEMEVQKNLRAKLAMLVLQLPPHAVTRMKGEKYGDLAFSTNMILEAEDGHGILEEETPQSQHKTPAHAPVQAQGTPRGPVSNAYAHQSATTGQYRTPAAAPIPGRGNSTYYPQSQSQATRTSSISYPRTTGGVPGNAQSWSGAYSSQGQRTSMGTPGYNQTPSRPAYPQNGQYQQPMQTQLGANRGPSFGNYYQPGTPQANYAARQYQQSPLPPNYAARPAASTPTTYGYPPQAVQSPSLRTASPLQAGQAAASPAQYNRPGSAQTTRSQYYGPPQAAAIGPSGFHSSMSTHEQQALVDRQRAQAQMAYQTNQARLAAALPSASGSSAPSIAGYTPPRQLSNTPQPPPMVAQQVNGTPGA